MGARLRRVLVVLLALSLLATAASAQEAQLEQDLQESRSQAERARERLDRLSDRVERAAGALERTEQRLSSAETRLAQLQDRVVAATVAYEEASRRARAAAEHLARVTARLDRTRAELAGQEQVLSDRVAAAYKYGGVSLTSVLLESQDISDFLNTAKYVGTVMDRDKSLVDEIAELVAQVTRTRAEADQARAAAAAEEEAAAQAKLELEQTTAEHAELTKQVRARRDERASQVAELEDDRSGVESHLQALQEQSGRIEDELAELARRQREEAERRAAEAAAAAAAASAASASSSGSASASARAGGGSSTSSAGGSASGGWSWPAACGRVTSRYGQRWGRMHEGVDISCGSGSQILAARGGVVYSTYCGGGYGNCVLVDHGGGYVTLYAHQSRIAVSQGQSVSAGQVIGFEGSTGHSTGPHLHFEVRVNGSPRNPCNYIGC